MDGWERMADIMDILGWDQFTMDIVDHCGNHGTNHMAVTMM